MKVIHPGTGYYKAFLSEKEVIKDDINMQLSKLKKKQLKQIQSYIHELRAHHDK